MAWKWYQSQIAAFFRRVPDAVVIEDTMLPSKSGVDRQIDVVVDLTFRVRLTEFLATPCHDPDHC